MKQYPKYKESGIQWIGQVPEHWEVMKARYFSSLEHGQSYKPDDVVTENGILVLRASNIQDGKLSFEDCVSIKPSQVVANKLVSTDDIIICSTNGSLALVGKSMIIDKPIEASFGSFMMRMRTKQNTRFVNYQLGVIVDYFRGTFATTTINQLTIDTLGNMQFLLPPLSEQEVIAGYLDKQTGKIDKSIESLEQQKADLQQYRTSVISEAVTRGLNPNAPLKDSGVQWIGQIPEEWKIGPLKYCCEIYGRIGFRGYTTGDMVEAGQGAITLSPSNVKDAKMDYTKLSYLSWDKYEESPEIKIYNGDILFTKTGSSYGKSAYVNHLPMEATINPQLVVFKNFKACSKFVAYSLQTPQIRKQTEEAVVGGTIPTLAQEKIGKFILPIPPLPEQEAIAAYLDEQTGKIDTAIATIDQQIADLRAYRTALITEAVTGKVDVRVSV